METKQYHCKRIFQKRNFKFLSVGIALCINLK